MQTLVQPLYLTGAGDEVRTEWGDIKFGLQERRFHAAEYTIFVNKTGNAI
jgi:hypothetical protein